MQAKNIKKDYDYILLDTSSLINGLYYGLKKGEDKKIKNVNGKKIDVTALRGYIGSVLSLKKEFPNSVIVHCLDPISHDKLFRKQISPIYKEQREPKDEELLIQLEMLPKLLDYLGLPYYINEKYEADDIISTLTIDLVNNENKKVLVQTRDKDLFQIMINQDKVHFLNDFKRIYDYNIKQFRVDYNIISTYAAAINKIKIQPLLLPEFLALSGDRSDNILKPNGLGEKTAIEILEKFGNIGNFFKKIMERPDEVEARYRKFFDNEENKKLVLFNMQLTTTRYDIQGLKKIPDLVEEQRSNIKMENLKRMSMLLDINENFLKSLTTNNELENKIDNVLTRKNNYSNSGNYYKKQ